MYTHLALIKNVTNPAKITKDGSTAMLDMDIIVAQALLLGAGSFTFKAIKTGELGDILCGIVALAYAALEPIALQDGELSEASFKGKPQYQMLAIMQLLSQGINACSSGQAIDYSNLYYTCSHLATDFLNADFDKAFLAYHEWRNLHPEFDEKPVKSHLPDLTDCLYE